MISRLEDRGDKSVTDLLEEITLPARCTWTWSPGTQGTVYALTGGLENLLEAKYRLNQVRAFECSNLYIHVRASMLGHPLMVRWVIGSIPHGGPIELFLIPASVP